MPRPHYKPQEPNGCSSYFLGLKVPESVRTATPPAPNDAVTVREALRSQLLVAGKHESRRWGLVTLTKDWPVTLVVLVGSETESFLHRSALEEEKATGQQSTSVEKCIFLKALSNPVPSR